MTLEAELIHQYPWVPSLKEVYTGIANEEPSRFLEEVFSGPQKEQITGRVYEFFKAAFDNLEHFHYYMDETNVYMYLLVKILLYILQNARITNKIANLYSKITHEKLINENDYNLYAICEDLNLNVKYQIGRAHV